MTATLTLTRVARKRSTYAARTGMNTRGAAMQAKALVERPRFVETEDGHLIRQFAKGELNSRRHEDIAAAMRGQRVVELEDMLQYVPTGAVQYAVMKGWLHPDATADYFWITKRAAAELELPRKSREGVALQYRAPQPGDAERLDAWWTAKGRRLGK